MVEVVPQPDRDPELTVQAQRLERPPQRLQVSHGLAVVPPPRAPAELPNQRPGEHHRQELFDKQLQVQVAQLRRVVALTGVVGVGSSAVRGCSNTLPLGRPSATRESSIPTR